jgi:hypothetical protein
MQGTSASPALPSWRRSLVLILLFGVLAALTLSLRIFERGEIWLDRTYWLTGIAALGGLAGAAATRAIWRLLSWKIARRWPRLVSAILFATAFMVMMTLAYVVHYTAITGQFEPREGRPLWAWLWITGEVAALFLISCPTYLLPWPLPALMLAAGWLLPIENGEETGNSSKAG